MGQATLVSREQIDGGEKLLARLRDRGVDVTAACWAKTVEDDKPYPYIASRAIVDHGIRPAYGEVRTARESLSGEWGHPLERIDPFTVNLVPPDNPMARALVDIHRRFPDRFATWFQGPDLGGTPLDGPAYIYPPTPAATVPAAGS